MNPEDLVLEEASTETVIPKAGRRKGAVGLNKLKEGKVIELIQPTSVANEEEPTPISMTAARKLLKSTKPPRIISEESKKIMLANLEKGRQVRAAMLKAKKEEEAKEVEVAKKELVIKKYIVKPKQQHRKRKIDSPNPPPEEDTEPIQTEDFTEADTDMEMYKKIKRQERLLKKIKQVKQQVAPVVAPVVEPLPPLQPPKKIPSVPVYSVFY
jgi:hypothetical protein